MRNPNGYGTIKKMSGKRRRPYAVCVTTRHVMQDVVPSVEHLEKYLSKETYSTLVAELEEYKKTHPPTKSSQVQKPIGYYETLRDAKIALAEYNKNPFDIDKRDVTFEQIYNKVYERDIVNKGTSSKRTYRVAYDKCDSIKHMRIRDIKLAHLQNIVDQHANKSKSTQTNIIVLFHLVYSYCMENDLCEKDYSEYVKITSSAEKKAKSPYSKSEIQTIWDNLDWQKRSHKIGAITGLSFADSLLVMIYTGVRIGELLDIRIDDVHLEERWMRIRGTKTKAADRIIPIHKEIIPLIEARLQNPTGELLFGTKDGARLTYSQYKKLFFTDFSATFGMDHTPHECRHTFASIAAASGLNPVLLKKIIGHSSSDITENVYTHAYVEDLINEIDKFTL